MADRLAPVVKRILLSLIALVCLATACSNPSQPYAARVNGSDISIKDVEDEIRVLADNPDSAASLESQLSGRGGLRPGGDNTINSSYAAQVVYTRILDALFQSELSRLNLSVNDEDKAKAEQALRASQAEGVFDRFPQKYREYTIDRQSRLDKILAFRGSDAELRKTYDAHIGDYNETCIRYIVLDNEAEANALTAQLRGGADFAAAANERSLDSPTRQGGPPNGGELGCLTQDRLDRLPVDYLDVIKKTEVNQITDPVTLQGVFFISQVTQRRQIPFEEAKAQVQQKYASADALFVELLGNAKVKVNPRYGDYVKPTDQTANQSPVAPRAPYALTPDPDPAEASPMNNGLFQTPPPQ